MEKASKLLLLLLKINTYCSTLERKLFFALLLSLISSYYLSVHIQMLKHNCDIQNGPWNGKRRPILAMSSRK